MLAATAAQADALATALAVMPPREGLTLAEAMPGVEAMIQEAGQQYATSGWAACQAPAPLPANFQVEVSYTLPAIEASNYRKPYVLIWVTDADKNPVKTLLILGAKRDYQEDNYIWWRRYGRKEPTLIDTMAKPTRPPGRYTVAGTGRTRPAGGSPRAATSSTSRLRASTAAMPIRPSRWTWAPRPPPARAQARTSSARPRCDTGKGR